VPKAQAEHLLVQAFLAEAVDEIVEPRLAEAILARLAAWLDRLV
jgi:Fe-S cluster assembly protein SufD